MTELSLYYANLFKARLALQAVAPEQRVDPAAVYPVSPRELGNSSALFHAADERGSNPTLKRSSRP